MVVVVDDDGDAGAVVDDAAATPVVEVVAAPGAFTVNWDPVTTVTWAPSTVGPRAVITAPDSDLATSCAAAWSAAVLAEKYTTVSAWTPTGGESPVAIR